MNVMKQNRITKSNFFSSFCFEEKPWQSNYLAMYSSQWNGITTDPDLMMIPADDHLVHRGDGAFDVIRCFHGKIYQIEEHLQRLEKSIKAISLEPPAGYNRIRDLIKELVLTGGEKECLIRIIVSRGPGSFTINPYDCPSSQLYINVVRSHTLPREYYEKGITLVTSHIPIKKPFFANIKSCNYLPNVLMKKEAIDAGSRYAVAIDENGFLAEGSTENIGVLTADGVLKFPGFEKTLLGITASRVFQLAGDLKKENIIKRVKFADISPEDAYNAKEIFLTGTSINLLPVVKFDGRVIGEGLPGAVYSRLSDLLWKDMTENSDLLNEINWKST